MFDHTSKTRAWLAEFAAINAEIEAYGMPAPRRTAKKRIRKLKPLWEE